MKDGLVHLIRHSTTTGIERHVMYGSADLPLSEGGYALLDTLIAEGIYPSAAGCDLVSSGMLRANQTLCRIYGEVPFAVAPALREMAVGICECKTHEEMAENPDYLAWLSDQTGTVVIPGGESVRGFSRRVGEGFAALLESAPRDVILVCHGGVIASLLYASHAARDGAPPESFFTYLPKPARGYTLEIRGGEIVGEREI